MILLTLYEKHSLQKHTLYMRIMTFFCVELRISISGVSQKCASAWATDTYLLKVLVLLFVMKKLLLLLVLVLLPMFLLPLMQKSFAVVALLQHSCTCWRFWWLPSWPGTECSSSLECCCWFVGAAGASLLLPCCYNTVSILSINEQPIWMVRG